MEQLVLSSNINNSDGWCSRASDIPAWNGIDFSQCFQRRILNGVIPATFIFLSFLAIFLAILYSVLLVILRTMDQPIKLNEENIGISAIQEVENEIIQKVADSENSNLTLGYNSNLEIQRDGKRATSLEICKSLMNKDLLELVIGGVIALLLIQKALNGSGYGSKWLYVAAAAWVWVSFLHIVKYTSAVISKIHHFEGLPRRNTSLYSTVELHLTPFYLIYFIVSFFDFRTAILSQSQGLESVFMQELLSFALVSILTSIEIFSPRISEFSPQPDSKLQSATEVGASLFSLATFSFIDHYLIESALKSRPYSLDDVPNVRQDDMTAAVLLEFRKKNQNSSLTYRLLAHFKNLLLLQQFYAYIRVATVAIPPLFLQLLLSHIARRKEENLPNHVAVLYAFGMVFFQVTSGLCASQSLYIGRRMCIRIRSIIVSEIFNKALRRKDQGGSKSVEGKEEVEGETDLEKEKAKEKEKENATAGRITNLISVDTFRLSEVAGYFHFVYPELSLTIIVTIYLLFQVLGFSTIAGVGTLILITPLQAGCSKLFYVYQKKLLAAADERLNLATEVISSIRVVKFFSWEKSFLAKMDIARELELKWIWMRALTMILSGLLMFGAPVIVSTATFIFHTQYLNLPLPAETAFTALALFNILRGPLEGFSDMIVNILQAKISLDRIDEFLKEEETEKFTNLISPEDAPVEDAPVIGFTDDASFSWSTFEGSFKLSGLNLRFPEGKLSLIIGPVGSGKSSLLLSLLGETNKLSGASHLPSPLVRSSTGKDPSILTESSAYCSQNPWLLSESIKENILFGAAYNAARYNLVLESCCLLPDLKVMENGDETEVGEKGSVLSGGQKARISLARALYSSARYILLDDVLSATAHHLFEHCLQGPILRHRTIVLVTHAVELCSPGAAFIVSMEDGVVTSSGSPSRTSRSVQKHLPVESLVNEPGSSLIEEQVDIEAEEAKASARASKKLGKIQETQTEGAVGLDIWLLYIRSMGGLWLVAGSLSVFIAAQVSEIGVSLALRFWAASFDQDESIGSIVISTVNLSLSRSLSMLKYISTTLSSSVVASASSAYYLKIYLIIALINLILYGARVAVFMAQGIVASRKLYTRLIDGIIFAPIRFFDTVPQGRILNRLSKDTECIDQDTPIILEFLLLEILGTLGILLTISVTIPLFFFAAVAITLMYWAIGYVYLSASRELKRSESVTRSPLFSIFGEVLTGVSSIRAYGDSARFTRNIFNLLNINNRPFWLLWQCNRWLSVRVDAAGAVVCFLTALFVLYSPSMDAPTAGFVLSFAISFNDRILWVVRLWSMNEINFNSIERVKEYLELDSEARDGIDVPANWPSRDGSIEVKNLEVRYAPELETVLKGITFSVLPKEKVGIVGRTGSGKSTLSLAFFRFIESSAGSITIDGIDISQVKLSDLRGRITIVAQESLLFTGTLRFNLDPFGKYQDWQLWDALERCQMAGASTSTRQTPAPSRPASPGGNETVEKARFIKSLDMLVTEGGKNFSAGEKQLIALARGVLKLSSGSSILILDESTASLDQATDEQIQRTIREEMQEATILTIAHRLRTIIDYDKILVLGDGKILEFDSPQNLLKKDSEFAALCKKSGEYEELLEISRLANL